jgi:Fuc2NAc and GlcNAc transferase
MTLVDQLPLVALLAGFLTTAGLLLILVRFASQLKLVAYPNQRSSHSVPTPTGGGIAIAVPVLLWCAFAPEAIGVHLALAGGVLALTGFLDDVYDLPALPRFVIQAGCVGGFLYATGAASGVLVLGLTGLGVLWFVNLFNFMDGIDGIAAGQALVFGVGVLLVSGATLTWLESFVWVVVGSSLGFLIFNWHPARIFMGDAGALLLGICIPAIAIGLDRSGDVPLVASLILLAAFLFDATFTLGVRVFTGQQFTAAHRSHLYQRLARQWGHGRATTAFLLYAGLWLLPLAAGAARAPAHGPWLWAMAILPLLVLAIRYRAGRRDVEARQPPSARVEVEGERPVEGQ